MSTRITTLDTMLLACEAVNSAAESIREALMRLCGGESLPSLDEEIDAATSDIVPAIDQIRAAVREYETFHRPKVRTQ